MSDSIKMPTFDELMNPMLKAMRELGGSASINEIFERVSVDLNLPQEITDILHNPEKSSQTEVEYRLAWARTYLKKFGVVENTARGVWVIKPEYMEPKNIDSQEVVRAIRAKDAAQRELSSDDTSSDNTSIVPDEELSWRSHLHHILTKKLSPEAFERLAQRILRESGFVQVEVTGRVGDGGIDGKGIVRLNGILSFHVAFQCKRYSSSVGAPLIRDFRGALMGRADKGLFITTGTFTRDAILESTRDGATPIDLIDGEMLADMLKNMNLGISTKLVEEVSVDSTWFEAI